MGCGPATCFDEKPINFAREQQRMPYTVTSIVAKCVGRQWYRYIIDMISPYAGLNFARRRMSGTPTKTSVRKKYTTMTRAINWRQRQNEGRSVVEQSTVSHGNFAVRMSTYIHSIVGQWTNTSNAHFWNPNVWPIWLEPHTERLRFD